MNVWEFCKCDGGQICLSCKVLIGVGVAVVSGLLGYFIGRRRKK